jgi:hypothetical protein
MCRSDCERHSDRWAIRPQGKDEAFFRGDHGQTISDGPFVVNNHALANRHRRWQAYNFLEEITLVCD